MRASSKLIVSQPGRGGALSARINEVLLRGRHVSNDNIKYYKIASTGAFHSERLQLSKKIQNALKYFCVLRRFSNMFVAIKYYLRSHSYMTGIDSGISKTS